MPEWNRAQLDAIEAKGGSIFVSAAAGSGKMAVLVERVIRQIVSGEVSADRFLIVTFTKAAAAELRQRIGEAIEDKINTAESEEEIRFLIRQRNLLPLARISTIDSFTQTLVRENSRSLGLPSKFEILEDKEIALYSEEILNETLEKLYDEELQGEESPLFELLELICDDKDDGKLVEAIKKLHGNADALALHALDHRRAQHARKQRVLREILEVSTAQRVALQVHAGAEQRVHAIVAALFGDRRAV